MGRPAATAELAPSLIGRTAATENFPVASRLLSAKVRGKILAFYAFARCADDIADDPGLSAEEKLARLDALDWSLAGSAPNIAEAEILRIQIGDRPHLLIHAANLLEAFRRDAVVDECRDWVDLMTYCQFSAAPVGRFMLELHGEGRAAFPASDALCSALQVLNHLQDCGQDYDTLGRVYLPADWMAQAGVDRGSLAAGAASTELRRLLDQILDQVDGLLDVADALPGHIRSRRLALEVSVILAVARRLAASLRHQDPLACRVRLSPFGYVCAVLEGLGNGLTRP